MLIHPIIFIGFCLLLAEPKAQGKIDSSDLTPILWHSLPFDAESNHTHVDSLQGAGYWQAHKDTTNENPELKQYVLGPLYTISKWTLVLEPNNPSLQFSFEEQLQSFKGLRASRENWHLLRQSIELVLRDSGFPLATYHIQRATQPLTANPNPENLHLEIRILLHEGFKLGGLLSQGSRTSSTTLLRLSLLEYGETFSENRIGLGLARLKRTGYFDEVDSVGLVRDSHRNLVYPVLKLTDAMGNRIGGLLGYDNNAEENALSGFIDIHLVNIRGSGRDFDFNFNSRPQGNGRSDRQVDFQYLEPWLPGLPVGLRVSGSIWLQDSIYDQLDGSLGLLHDLDMHSLLEVTFSRQWSLDKLADEESQSFAGGIALILDHRNQVPFPTRGYHLEMRSQGIRRELTDSSRYLVQSQIIGHAYIPLVSRLLFHGKWDGGGNWPRHPLAMRGDRFDLGGARTLRGYREREFSTDLYGYSQLELQWLLAGQGRVMAFVSPGLIDKQTPSLWWTSVFGYGVGMELGSKAWSVGFLYALNPKRDWGEGFIHLTLDNRF